MTIFETPEHLTGSVLPSSGKAEILPTFMKREVSQDTEMNLDELRKTLIPTDEMARKVEFDSDPIGGIHGLKLILTKSGNYKGRIDGSLDESKARTQKGNEVRANPLVKGLINFQMGYNSPFRLGEDGKPTIDPGVAVGNKSGIPKEEIGKLGPITIEILLDYARRAGLELPPSRGDKKFENGADFGQKYGPMLEYLTQSFGLPKNLILGIAKQESNLGTNPADYWGGNGVLQLTSAPLADMSGVTQDPRVTDKRKIKIYQGIYQKIDPDALKKLPFGSRIKMNTLESSLDEEAWNVVDTLCDDASTPDEFRSAMQKVRSWERGKFRGLTYHTLNILVGSAYLSYIQNYRMKGSQNVARIAAAYNGSEHQAAYGEKVADHVAKYSTPTRNTQSRYA